MPAFWPNLAVITRLEPDDAPEVVALVARHRLPTIYSDHAFPKIGGLAIGLTVALDILFGGPFTGAAMNPARVFGPALASGHWTGHAIYWIGPLLGGALAGLIYGRFLIKQP